jgi:hypothetical protein
VLHLRLIIFLVGDNVFIDSEMLLVTNFVNLKIRSNQSSRCAHRGGVYMHVFIGVSARTCMSICVSKKKVQTYS